MTLLRTVVLALEGGGGDWAMRAGVIAQATGQEAAYHTAQGDAARAEAMGPAEVLTALHDLGRALGCTQVWGWREMVDTALLDALVSGGTDLELTPHVRIHAREDMQICRGDPDIMTVMHYTCRGVDSHEYREGDEERLLTDAWEAHRQAERVPQA